MQHTTILECSVCHSINDHLLLKCAQCGAVLRDRVANVNLFSTMYSLMESPWFAFQKIERSEQKNYVFVLFTVAGPIFLAAMYFFSSLPNRSESFGEIFLVLFGIGLMFGLVFLTFQTFVLKFILRVFVKTSISFSSLSALVAYAMTPYAIASSIILPLQLGIFGVLLFGNNPAPFEYRSLEFWLLAGIDIVLFLWSTFLLGMGLTVHIRMKRTLLLTVVVLFDVSMSIIIAIGSVLV